ncbi:MAG: SUMF1/EgtB/PvdO family nonheme iron enzyme [Nitrospirae bacterium]|nr:SUMF1/EgtB/PvdO family nonheme iron enzyme [Nitrospirota bacterium]
MEGLYKESYALVIGVSEYTAAGVPSLPGVREDVQEVSNVLKLHGFKVQELLNPDRKALEKAFTDFIHTYGLEEPQNRLLIYFAGHGHTETQSWGGEMGYILPSDVPNPYRDRKGFLKKAMDMQMIEVYAKRIQSKHALFMFDSCFSGDLFDLTLTRSISASISDKTTQPVRQFITSGRAKEKVPDKSIFREIFVSALKGEFRTNQEGYLTATELGELLSIKVTNYSNNTQHPQIGKIRDRNLDKGDFVFVLSGDKENVGKPEIDKAKDELSKKAQEVEENRKKLEEERELFEIDKKKKDLDEENKKIEEERKRLKLENERLAMASRPGEEMLSGKGSSYIEDKVTGMEFVFVKGGCYQMGDMFGDGYENEKPVHEVCVDDFYLGKYEVTNAQFKKFADDTGYRTEAEKENKGFGISGDGKNDWGWKAGLNWMYPIYPSDDISSKMSHPVVQVSWNDAKEFIIWLNKKTGGKYKLPTEAEWEYACRNGGKQHKYSWGNGSPSGNIADEAFKRKYPNAKVWAGYDDGYAYTAPVGSYRASELGLYDMTGNVWEWVEDIYAKDAYSKHQRDNPIYTGPGEGRVIRGGSWLSDPRDVRYSFRHDGAPSYRDYNLGFRLEFQR